MDDHDRVGDRLALRALVDGYAVALDGRDITALGALFADDAEVVIHDIGAGLERATRIRRGRDQIVVAVPRMIDRYLSTFHLMGQQLLEFGDASSANGIVYCIANHISETPEGSRHNRVVSLVYRDRYEREEMQGWRFRRRELHYQFVEHRPISSADS